MMENWSFKPMIKTVLVIGAFVVVGLFNWFGLDYTSNFFLDPSSNDEKSYEQEAQVLSIAQVNPPFEVTSPIPTITNVPTINFYGTKSFDQTVHMNTDTMPMTMISDSAYPNDWQFTYNLHEGLNHFHFQAEDGNGTVVATRDYNITLDRNGPTCNLSYSSTVANVGDFDIVLNCNEQLKNTPKISIDQPGAKDIFGAQMARSGTLWKFIYSVQPADGTDYKDGEAFVSIASQGDMAGNPIVKVTNKKFLIDTSNQSITEPTGSNANNGDVSVDTTTIPEMTFTEFRQKDLNSSYLPASIIHLVLKYKVDSEFILDKNLGDYSYIGEPDFNNYNGFYVNFGDLDSNFGIRRVLISARREIGTDTFERIFTYHLSEDNNNALPHSGVVNATYIMNGKPIVEPKDIKLTIVPIEQLSVKLTAVNNVDVDYQTEFQITNKIIVEHGFTIYGVGPPNTRLIIHIYSDPIVDEVVTDDEGNWEYTITEELSEGEHSVYVALAEDGEEPTDFTKIFSFNIIPEVEALGDTSVSSELVSAPVDDIKSKISLAFMIKVLITAILSIFIVYWSIHLIGIYKSKGDKKTARKN